MTKKIIFIKILTFIILIFFQSNQLAANNKTPSQWVEDISNQTLIILGDDLISSDKKVQYLENIFIENLDIKRISLFILGPYRKNLKSSELQEAITKTLKQLHGSFALGVIFKDKPDLIVGARRG